MAHLCKEVIATDKWARERERPGTEHDCSTCEMGSITAFFATGIVNGYNYCILPT